MSFRSQQRRRRHSTSARVKTLKEDGTEDPFIDEHTYTLPYRGEPDYASWINQETLPLPTKGNASLKRNARAGPLAEPRASRESFLNTIQRQNKPGSAHQSPKFVKQDSSPLT